MNNLKGELIVENNSNMNKLLNTMNEVVMNLTTVLNELDKEISKKIKELSDDDE